MDIAAYISDLLRQLGELTIPGLGRFARMRISGYYNEEGEMMYPPSYRLSFDPTIHNADDTIANRISFLKNISLTSSQYFLDKFVLNLKEDAAKGQVPFGDLGYFYEDQNGVLKFDFHNDDLTKDEGFFGFVPLKIKKLRKETPVITPPRIEAHPQPAAIEAAQTEETPVAVSDAVIPEEEEAQLQTEVNGPQEQKRLTYNDIFSFKKHVPVEEPAGLSENITPEAEALQDQSAEMEEFIAEEKEAKSAVDLWVILVIIVALSGAALFGLYKYDPSLFDKLGRLQSKHASSPLVNKVKPNEDTEGRGYTVKTDSGRNKDTAGINHPTTAQPGPAAVVKTDTIAAATKAAAAPVKKVDSVAKIPAKTKAEPVASAKRNPPVVSNAPVAVETPAPAASGNMDVNGNEIIPNVSTHHYEVYGESTHDIKEAQRALRAYKTLGFDGHIIQNYRKTHFRVSLGTYSTYKEAKEAFNKMIATKKVSEIDLSVEPYTYKIK